MMQRLAAVLIALMAFAAPALAQTPPLVKICTQVDGSTVCLPVSGTNPLPVGTGTPSAAAAAGIVPVRTPVAASNLVLKGSAGNLYGVELTSGASAGYLMIFDATTAPVDGTVTPVYAKAVAANSTIELNWTTPAAFTTGIVAVFSTTGPFTKTASVTAFISGMVK